MNRVKYDRFPKGTPEDLVHDKALMLMEADPTGKLEYTEAVSMVYIEEPGLGKLPKESEG